MSKLIVAYIVENDEDVFELSYNSIKDVADEIVIIDGNHEDKHKLSRYAKNIISKNKDNKEFLENTDNDFQGKTLIMQSPDYDNIIIKDPYPHEDKGANGIQRNKYLDYIKGNFPGEWCLVLDADEVVDQPDKIKETIAMLEEQGLEATSPAMRHFIGNFGYEDATQEKHFCPLRLFKIKEDLSYPEVEHPVLQGISKVAQGSTFTIWHLSYCREMFRIKNKTKVHREKSNMHSQQFLDWWQHSHMFGTYPVRPVKFEDLPKILIDHFNINQDYMYFKDRTVELKHAECVKQWTKYFDRGGYDYPQLLEIGCGRGPYLRYWEMTRWSSQGLELSKWAIDNKICESRIKEGNVLDIKYDDTFDLVTAIDILEHLEEEDLPKALNNIYELGRKDFLFSIPFDADPETGEPADPNLRADPTHKIFKSRTWWLAELKKAGFKIKETPQHWLFANQIIIAEK